MSKRQREDPNGTDPSSDTETDGSELDFINVDFEFFSPQENDFHAIKHLLSMQFLNDSEELCLSDAANIIISQGSDHGTTVKVDGETGDPYSITTVLHATDKNSMKYLHRFGRFLLRKCNTKKFPEARTLLETLLKSSEDTEKEILNWGWLINDRLVNVPPQIAPPSFQLLHDELKKSVNEDSLEYLIIISKTFREVEKSHSDTDDTPNSAIKKRKKKTGRKQTEMESFFHYNAEEEIFGKFAVAQFSYIPNESRSEEALSVFNDDNCAIIPGRLVSVVPTNRLSELVAAIDTFVNGPTAESGTVCR